jgi:hypothetical protein
MYSPAVTVVGGKFTPPPVKFCSVVTAAGVTVNELTSVKLGAVPLNIPTVIAAVVGADENCIESEVRAPAVRGWAIMLT